jgi:Protein of unknown function (DUF3180)
MRPTRPGWLILLGIVTGGVAYLITRSSYGDLPTPKVYALLSLAVLAIAELYIAVFTRSRLTGQSGTRPIDPLVVARFAALAKASSIVGALASGAYAGFLIWVARLDSPAGQRDTRNSAIGVGLSLALVSAALFLESVCRVHDDDDDEGQ